MARFPIAVALLATMISGPAKALYEYRVTGVAAGDVLNIREGVEAAGQVSSARIIGSIPPNAEHIKGTGVTVNVGGSVWRQVIHGGVTGWVSARFLAEMDDGGGGEPPVNLLCTGTEPFWSMTFDASSAVRKDPFGAGTGTLTSYVPERGRLASGRRHVWSVMLRPAEGSQPATANFLRTDACSDDMSDFVYPIEFILTEHAPDGVVLSGCCSMNR